MENDLKVGDVIQIKDFGYGFLKEDIGKWVEVVRFGAYGCGDIAIEVKCYDENLASRVGSNGRYLCGLESFGENPMILLNTIEEQELINKAQKHNHYFKDCPYDKLDVYRLLSIFEVTDPCLQHLVKKGLCAGKRGHKDFRKDLQDIIDTAQRRIDMLEEDELLE